MLTDNSISISIEPFADFLNFLKQKINNFSSLYKVQFTANGTFIFDWNYYRSVSSNLGTEKRNSWKWAKNKLKTRKSFVLDQIVCVIANGSALEIDKPKVNSTRGQTDTPNRKRHTQQSCIQIRIAFWNEKISIWNWMRTTPKWIWKTLEKNAATYSSQIGCIETFVEWQMHRDIIANVCAITCCVTICSDDARSEPIRNCEKSRTWCGIVVVEL